MKQPPYKRLQVQIPTELYRILGDYGRSLSVSTDEVINTAVARLTERVLIQKALADRAYITPLQQVHALRMEEGSTTPTERLLFDIATLELGGSVEGANHQIRFTPCSRTYLRPAISRPLIKPLHEARGATTIHNFVTEAIFLELTHRFEIIEAARNQYMETHMSNSEFIQAESNNAEYKKLYNEIRELRARLTRLELQRMEPIEDSNLISEVLISLINSAADAKHP